VVITFTDISAFKRLESEARGAQRFAESITDTIREPLMVMDADLTVRSANRSFYLFFRTTSRETEGKRLYELGNGQWDVPVLRSVLEKVISQKADLEDYRVEHEFPRIGRRVMLLNARLIGADAARPDLILLAFEDVTEGPKGQAR
jgi:two-component system CheB/CheR fusion protein